MKKSQMYLGLSVYDRNYQYYTIILEYIKYCFSVSVLQCSVLSKQEQRHMSTNDVSPLCNTKLTC